MTEQHPLTVGEVAALTGVTVRTLHHYDAVGLVRPAARTPAGYRLYSPDDVARLQEVVAYRRLGFGLDEIPGPAEDRRAALVRQRELVEAKLAELEGLRRALDAALDPAVAPDPATPMTAQEDPMTADRRHLDVDLTPRQMRDLFGDDYTERFDGHQAEAESRWGDTAEWAESRRRTARYAPADWAEVKAEADAAHAALAEALRAGLPPTSDAAMDAAEAMRRHIDGRFYPCPPAVHRDLGAMYVADPRFARTYEEIEPGLAAYARDAIHANADRLEREG